jgi:DNA mismatch repair ATPase MutS
VKKGNKVNFTTFRVIELNRKIQDSHAEIVKTTYNLVDELLLQVRDQMECLHNLSYTIGTIDVIQALAGYAVRTQSCFPAFEKSAGVIIKDGKHPILAEVSSV